MISAVRPKATRLCHSVLSCQLPCWSLARSAVAREKVATMVPPGVERTSGSLPTLPRRSTLFTPFAMRDAPICQVLKVEDSRWGRGGAEPGEGALILVVGSCSSREKNRRSFDYGFAFAQDD